MERKDIQVENFNEFREFSCWIKLGRFCFDGKSFPLSSVHCTKLISITIIVIAISTRHQRTFPSGSDNFSAFISVFEWGLNRFVCKLLSTLKSAANSGGKFNEELLIVEIKLFFDLNSRMWLRGLHKVFRNPKHIYESKRHKKSNF